MGVAVGAGVEWVGLFYLFVACVVVDVAEALAGGAVEGFAVGGICD